MEVTGRLGLMLMSTHDLQRLTPHTHLLQSPTEQRGGADCLRGWGTELCGGATALLSAGDLTSGF